MQKRFNHRPGTIGSKWVRIQQAQTEYILVRSCTCIAAHMRNWGGRSEHASNTTANVACVVRQQKEPKRSPGTEAIPTEIAADLWITRSKHGGWRSSAAPRQRGCAAAQRAAAAAATDTTKRGHGPRRRRSRARDGEPRSRRQW